MVRISAQSNVVYWSYCPKTHQNGNIWVLNQKNVVLLLSNIENNKYTETETGHPERVEEYGPIIDYVRISDKPLARSLGAI